MTKEFSFSDGVFTVLITAKNYVGSIAYDFKDGTLSSHRPENMSHMDWLICCRKFITICLKMNAPFLDI